MADDFEGEIAFLRLRETEQLAELAENLKALGESMGVGVSLSPEDVTPEIAERFAQQVADVLQRSGNRELADRWVARYRVREEATKRLEGLIAQAEVDGVDETMRTTLEEARGAMNDAQEHFERVAAETSAWLTKNG